MGPHRGGDGQVTGEVGQQRAAQVIALGHGAALEVAFDGVGLDEIWSMTAVLNEPSVAVMRRLGLREVARFSHPQVPEGHPLRPHVTYHLARPPA
jgi:RimJ/RimL family protein N-acetyltransferase